MSENLPAAAQPGLSPLNPKVRRSSDYERGENDRCFSCSLPQSLWNLRAAPITAARCINISCSCRAWLGNLRFRESRKKKKRWFSKEKILHDVHGCMDVYLTRFLLSSSVLLKTFSLFIFMNLLSDKHSWSDTRTALAIKQCCSRILSEWC